jgi:hypothetical protein
MERVAAIATLGDDGASGKAEALDALHDVIGHPVHHSPLDIVRRRRERWPGRRRAENALGTLAART